jgi:hypothetical protein
MINEELRGKPKRGGATMNHHPPVHHPLDVSYYSVVDEPQTEFIFGYTLVTNSVGNMSRL